MTPRQPIASVPYALDYHVLATSYDEPFLRRIRNEMAGAGLDVYEHEPQVSPELTAMTNVVLTPHLGSAVLELREGMANVVADNCIALIEGKPPVSCLNPEVLKKLF